MACCTRACFGFRAQFFFVATIASHFFIVCLAITTVGFAAVAFLAKELDVGCLAAAPAGIGDDVIVFELVKTTAALAHTPVAGKDYFFGGFRNVPALGKGKKAQEKKRK